MNGLALCAGIGGLDLGISRAVPEYRPVCYVEGEAFAAATLVAQMEAGNLAPAPIWSDVHTFDPGPWRGRVDIISGGYPCQPFSFAGKRKGTDDPRHLWPAIAGIVGAIEPALCFFENVPGHLSLGFEEVVQDLEGMGYRVAAGLFTAEEVGAPHKRERLFILAVGDAYQPRLEGRRPTRPCADERTAWTPGSEVGPEAWPADVPQPAIRRGSDGLSSRVDRIRALGNAVVPQCAELAFRTLAQSLTQKEAI